MHSRIMLLLVTLIGLLAAREAEPVLPKPSSNAGKSGTYQVQCGKAGYSYWVSVPPRPAAGLAYGLHIFFHGQGGGGPGCANFGQWDDKLLRPFGLIGINMAYADGDNMKDSAGKVQVAKEAVLQVMADYPVAPGRGMTACFSGGGIPCGMWYANNQKSRGLAWPFTALALYGANFNNGVQKGPPTGWLIGIAKDEWGMAQPSLGTSQTARFGEALAMTDALGPDHDFVLVDGGHGIYGPQVEAAARLFRRIDLAYCPFLHLPEWSERPLLSIAAQANSGQIGAAFQTLARLKDGKLPDDRVEALRAALDARAQAQVALLGELAGTDPLLAAHYAGFFQRSLKGHPRSDELKPVLDVIAKDRPRAAAANTALDAFAKAWSGIFAGNPIITQKSVPVLEAALRQMGETAELGALVKSLLALPRAQNK